MSTLHTLHTLHLYNGKDFVAYSSSHNLAYQSYWKHCRNTSLLQQFFRWFGDEECVMFYLFENDHPVVVERILKWLQDTNPNLNEIGSIWERIWRNPSDKLVQYLVPTSFCRYFVNTNPRTFPAVKKMIREMTREDRLLERDSIQTILVNLWENCPHDDNSTIRFVWRRFDHKRFELPFTNHPYAQHLVWKSRRKFNLLREDMILLSTDPEINRTVLNLIECTRNRSMQHAVRVMANRSQSPMVLEWMLAHPNLAPPQLLLTNPHPLVVEFFLEHPETIDEKLFLMNKNPRAVEWCLQHIVMNSWNDPRRPSDLTENRECEFDVQFCANLLHSSHLTPIDKLPSIQHLMGFLTRLPDDWEVVIHGWDPAHEE